MSVNGLNTYGSVELCLFMSCRGSGARCMAVMIDTDWTYDYEQMLPISPQSS